MGGMFADSQFNQPIGNWNVSKVTNMSRMFVGGTPFNQPLSGWNVSNVTNMSSMFGGNYDNQFNQPIGNWNISGVTNFNNFMSLKSTSLFSSTNLDDIYNGWVTKNPKIGITINFGSAKHTSASTTNKNILTSTYGWSITDGGVI